MRLSLILVLISFTIFVKAQEKRNQISVGAGLVTSNGLLSFFKYEFFEDGKRYYHEDSKFNFNIAYQYKYKTNRALNVFLSYGYRNYHSDNYYYTYVYNKYYTIAFEYYLEYMELEDGKFKFYGLAGLCATFCNTLNRNVINGNSNNEYELSFYPNIHYSPIGLKYEGKIGAYIEVGFGYRGIVSGGLTYKF